MENCVPQEPKVAVIIPTKDRRELIAETLTSLLLQTWLYWEVVVVDDGSVDSTESYVTDISKTEPRIHFKHRTGANGNANVCRNQGLEFSSAEFVIFLDSDDLLAPHCLEQRVRFMDRNPDIDCAVYPGRYFRVVPGDSEVGIGESSGAGDLDRLLGMHWPMQTTGPIWRRSALAKIGPWNEDLPRWQDVDFHFRALNSELCIVRQHAHDFYVRESLAYERTSTVQQSNSAHFVHAEKLFERMQGCLTDTGMLTRTRGYLLAGNYLHLAERRVAMSDGRAALRTWIQAYLNGLVAFHVMIGGVVYLLGILVGPRRLWHKLFSRWKWKWRLARGSSLF